MRREAFRVLRPGGVLSAGVVNPAVDISDDAVAQRGERRVRHRLPYSDAESVTAEGRARVIHASEPVGVSHSLEALIGGQTDAGFAITGRYEDEWQGQTLSRFMPMFIATRAIKP